MKRFSFFLLVFAVLLTSCSEYTKVLKSKDHIQKYTYAQKYFSEKKYRKATTLLEDIIPLMKGTEKGEEALYMLAKAYYEVKDYMMSSHYYVTYYTTYPRGKYTEEARFYAGFSMYKNVPDPRLDQSETYKAMKELQLFREYYPTSERAEHAEQLLYELQEILAEKAFLNVKLYYNLGTFLGNNYRASIITAQNALRDYPFSKFKQEYAIYTLRSRYAIAELTTTYEQRQEDRYREVLDEYYAFINEYPDLQYLKEATDIFKKVTRKINNEIIEE